MHGVGIYPQETKTKTVDCERRWWCRRRDDEPASCSHVDSPLSRSRTKNKGKGRRRIFVSHAEPKNKLSYTKRTGSFSRRRKIYRTIDARRSTLTHTTATRPPANVRNYKVGGFVRHSAARTASIFFRRPFCGAFHIWMHRLWDGRQTNAAPILSPNRKTERNALFLRSFCYCFSLRCI